MNYMECPYCGRELCEWNRQFYCGNLLCSAKGVELPKFLWQDFIRTRKALGIAVDELTNIKVTAESVGVGFFMTAGISALAKIKTTLEQKDE